MSKPGIFQMLQSPARKGFSDCRRHTPRRLFQRGLRGPKASRVDHPAEISKFWQQSSSCDYSKCQHWLANPETGLDPGSVNSTRKSFRFSRVSRRGKRFRCRIYWKGGWGYICRFSTSRARFGVGWRERGRRVEKGYREKSTRWRKKRDTYIFLWQHLCSDLCLPILVICPFEMFFGGQVSTRSYSVLILNILFIKRPRH